MRLLPTHERRGLLDLVYEIFAQILIDFGSRNLCRILLAYQHGAELALEFFMNLSLISLVFFCYYVSKVRFQFAQLQLFRPNHFSLLLELVLSILQGCLKAVYLLILMLPHMVLYLLRVDSCLLTDLLLRLSIL